MFLTISFSTQNKRIHKTIQSHHIFYSLFFDFILFSPLFFFSFPFSSLNGFGFDCVERLKNYLVVAHGAPLLIFFLFESQFSFLALQAARSVVSSNNAQCDTAASRQSAAEYVCLKRSQLSSDFSLTWPLTLDTLTFRQHGSSI